MLPPEGALDNPAFEAWKGALVKTCTREDALAKPGDRRSVDRGTPYTGVDGRVLLQRLPKAPRVELGDGRTAVLSPLTEALASRRTVVEGVTFEMAGGVCTVTAEGVERYKTLLFSALPVVGIFDPAKVGSHQVPFSITVTESTDAAGKRLLSLQPGFLVTAFTRALPDAQPADLDTLLGLVGEGGPAARPFFDGTRPKSAVDGLRLPDVKTAEGKHLTVIFTNAETPLTGPWEALAPWFASAADSEVRMDLVIDGLRSAHPLLIAGKVRLTRKREEAPGSWTGVAELSEVISSTKLPTP